MPRCVSAATTAFCLFSVLALSVTACSGSDSKTADDPPRLSGALQSYDSCDTALKQLKQTAKQHTADLFASTRQLQPETSGKDKSANGESAKETNDSSQHSDTNIAEYGVDEPDVVKTDGKRIITIHDGELIVTNTKSKKVAGRLALKTASGEVGADSQLLLHDDRVMVIADRPAHMTTPDIGASNAEVLLIDIGEKKPRLVNNYTFDGGFVDARAVDGVSRLVMRSKPQLKVPMDTKPEDVAEVGRKAIDKSTIDDWLPHYSLDGGKSKQIPCEAIARPEEFSGGSALTVLSFDLSKDLGDGDPVTIEADGQTVYGSTDGLYIANDQRELVKPLSSKPHTEIYRFGIANPKTPKFESSATVPGYLLNRYSMSEWDGHFRVATTTGSPSGNGEEVPASSSAVYVFAIGDDSLNQQGKVTGLGESEKIYAVRFIADTGYVVTFRQTDPLYIVDVSKPEKPAIAGEAKLTGYSAYLHPLGEDRLLGVGQEADDSGITTGAQISLFDVSDTAQPQLLDKYQLPNSESAVEDDPHAFMYWEDKALLALPTGDYDGGNPKLRILHIDSDGVSEVGAISHKASGAAVPISRSIVIDNELWTVSAQGLKASAMADYSSLAWLPYD